MTMTSADLIMLEKLLTRFRGMAIDRETVDKCESLRFDVEFEIGMMQEDEISENGEAWIKNRKNNRRGSAST